ncbi:MAG: hypothetical protein JNL82_38585 [Myxococcales bacterium]|nr:hypothetical protein [Myxococcales bacterium]
MRLSPLPLCLAACVDLELTADLEGPRVVGASLSAARSVEVPVRATHVLEFSEPLDPDSLRIALVPWLDAGSCTLTPGCAEPEATCERGRCQKDPLTAADLKRFISGDPPAGVAVTHVLEDTSTAPASRLRVTPARALTAHARHSLVVFARDRSGAALVGPDDAPAAWRRDLVTAGEGSSGPEPALVSPPPDAGAVPPNLAHVDTAFARPVAAEPSSALRLVAGDHEAALVDPTACPAWVPGLCLRWRADPPLRPATTYELAGGSLRDLLGQAAVPGAAAMRFTTAAVADTAAPDPRADLAIRGPCLYADLVAAEPLALELRVGQARDLAVTGGGAVSLGVRLADVAEGDEIPGTLIATDLAGNAATLDFTARAGPDAPGSRPPLGLAEILADPLGPEPRQEFVELADPRGAGQPAAWSDLYLADRPWSAVQAAADPPGDPLPAFMIAPGARVLVVAAGYDLDHGDDPPPAPGTALLRVDASIGDGGLKNAGEPLTLYTWSGGSPTLIAAYANHVSLADAGRSVVADPAACDLPRAWSPHPFGASSPGVAP